MGGFGRGAAEATGKAIPNEFAKLSSGADFLNFIPVIGPALAVAVKAIGAIDAGATTFGDTGSLSKGVSAGSKPATGRSTDPGRFGSGPEDVNKLDGLEKLGAILNFIPKPGTGGFGGGGDLPANTNITFGDGGLGDGVQQAGDGGFGNFSGFIPGGDVNAPGGGEGDGLAQLFNLISGGSGETGEFKLPDFQQQQSPQQQLAAPPEINSPFSGVNRPQAAQADVPDVLALLAALLNQPDPFANLAASARPRIGAA